jgi:TolB-like protein
VSERAEHEAGGLWDKLRRRKVVQWGIAYSVGAWGFLQGLEYVSEAFGWPGQLRQVAILALLVGLPVVLVIAWYHGDRGEQRVSGTELTIITLLFLVGGGIFWRYDQAADPSPAGDPQGGNAPAGAPIAAAAAPTGPSVAVLPFVNMSTDEDNEYFSDGISEELLNVLVRVDGLGVASRTSSFAYKGSKLGAAAIARELKVGHILEGSVRKSGNRVRITAQLIDAEQDRHLWSATYDRELNDIFAIQDEIANAIVTALRDELQPLVAAAPVVAVRADTENLEAYQLYLKARELFIARQDLPEAVRLFERVVELDPGFARGWEGLAAVCGIIQSWGIRDRDYTAQAREAANRALELDPSLSMPWAVLAMTLKQDWPVDYVRQFELLAQAIEADPRNATAYLWRSLAWLELGFFDRALADLDRCLELEQKYRNAVRHKALALLFMGRTDEALRLFEQGVATGFITSRAENFVGPLLARGNTLAVRLLMDDMALDPAVRDILIDSLQHPGQAGADRRGVIERFFSDPDSPYVVGLGLTHPYLWLGEFDLAGDSRDGVSSAIVAWDRYPAGWRNSAGFKHKLDAQGVTAYWRKHGYPPQCRSVGAADFTCD